MGNDLAFAWWCLAVGALLVVMTAGRPWIARLPLSAAMLYLGAGLLLGPGVAGLLDIRAIEHAKVLERVAEVAVLVSLFVAGFKLGQRRPPGAWRVPIRLASVSMVITVALVALAAYFLLGLSLGAAVLLGAILAPTDPVLASDVQLGHLGDRDDLRFALTGEGALNDGTAFPFVMLGLGLMGLHDLGPHAWRWWAVDVGWAVCAGLLLGLTLGTLIGRLLAWLPERADTSLIAHEFVALGLVALAYGAALLVHTYGFLAVFAAGFALRRAGHPNHGVGGAASVARRESSLRAVLHFNEQVERFGEFALVIVVGALVGATAPSAEMLWFVPLVFVVVRPLAVLAGTLRTRMGPMRRSLAAWFGIRGAGSIYYLAFAIAHGVPAETAQRLTGLTLAAVVASILLHGISVTPLMDWYERRKE